MDSYIVRIYRRISRGNKEQILGTVEDVSRSETKQFQGIDELARALTPLSPPKRKKKKNRASCKQPTSPHP